MIIKKFNLKWLNLFVFAFCLFFLLSKNTYAAIPKAPIILSPKNSAIEFTFTPTIFGVANNNTKIIVVIDDRIVGSTKTIKGKKTGSFRFITKKLKSGRHSVYVLAENKDGRSGNSKKIFFSIPKNVYRPLDGILIPLEKYRSWPVGIMIENLPVVRNNQRGLSQASVVYETLAEGGATRFLAIFDGENINASKIMPVRSVRSYYAQWAKEYNAVLMHAGGSPDGELEIRKLFLKDIDYLRGKTSKYFWRTDRSLSVHNLATSDIKINQMLSDLAITNKIPDFRAWKFKNEANLKNRGKNNSTVLIKFGSRGFDAEYKYDKNTNNYLRWNGHLIQKDANTNRQLSVKNIIIQYVPKEKVVDRKGRLDIKAVGQGKGLLLQDGKFLNIFWKKNKSDGRTIYTYPNKKEVEFVRGSIWVEVLPVNKTVIIQK